MREIIIASGNKGKIEEAQEILRGFKDKYIKISRHKHILNLKDLIKNEDRIACVTQRLYTLKDKPSRVNKRTKFSCKSNVEIHPVNPLENAV